MIKIQNILSERILKENIIRYQGVNSILNEAENGFKTGIVYVANNKLNFKVLNSKIKNDKFTFYSIKLSALHGYATTIFDKEKMPWKGDKVNKPDPAKCFKITYDENSNTDSTLFVPNKKIKLKSLYFCSLYNRNDEKMQFRLSNEMSMFLNNILVARINLKLHSLNLKKSQEKLKELKGDQLKCLHPLIEPIKYEIRLKVKFAHFINNIYSI